MFKNLFKNMVENPSVKNENQTFESENDIEKYNNRGHYNNNYKSNRQNQNPEKDNKNCYDGVDQSNNGGKKVKKEPYYLKMYINNINYSKEAKAVMNPVLVEVLYRVEPTTEDGKGQIIDLNDNVKSEIAQSLRISVRQVKEQISNLVESGILLYSQKQIYKLNYRYFAKGYFYRWRRYDE